MLRFLVFAAHFVLAFVLAQSMTAFFMLHMPLLPALLLGMVAGYVLTMTIMRSLGFVLALVELARLAR